MDWTKGYVADIGYTAGFYRETAPSHLAFAALIAGRSPGRALKPHRVLELGFGQGFGLALLAAANPQIAFEGYDFNPEHVAHARGLIDGAALVNLAVSETGFEEAAAQGGDNDIDVVTLHGIFSWVARGTQDAIVSILRQRLQPQGFLYISYNCMPGWAPLAPIRQLMIQVKRRNPGRSGRQLALALELVSKLKQGGAAFFEANPLAAQHLDAMLKMDRVYLAHEYLDEHWDLFQFSEMVARLGEAKLNYVTSATLPESLDAYAVPQNLLPLVQQIDDPLLKETVRDFAANKRFRRDLFARGTAALTPVEHRRLLSQLSFALVVPRSRVALKFGGPLMVLTGRDEFHMPIVDLLAEKNAAFEDLVALPPYGESKIPLLLDSLALLVHSGQVLPITTSGPIDSGPAQRFNQLIIAHARTGRMYHHLASPVTGTGVGITEFGLLTLVAWHDGKADELLPAARHVLSILKALGRGPMKDGNLIEDDDEATRFMAEQMKPIIEEMIPLWRRLGVL